MFSLQPGMRSMYHDTFGIGCSNREHCGVTDMTLKRRKKKKIKLFFFGLFFYAFAVTEKLMIKIGFCGIISEVSSGLYHVFPFRKLKKVNRVDAGGAS